MRGNNLENILQLKVDKPKNPNDGSNNPVVFLTNILHFVGWWPNSDWPTYKIRLYNIYTTIVFTIVLLQLLAGIMYCIKEPEITLHDVSMTVFFNFGEMTCLAAGITHIRGQKVLKKIIKMVNEDFDEYPEKLRIEWCRKGRIIGCFFTMAWPTWGLLYTLTPVFISLLDSRKNETLEKVIFPLDSWYPFDVNDSQTYKMLYVFQIISVVTGLLPATIFFGVFLIIILFVLEQFDWLNSSLRNIKFNRRKNSTLPRQRNNLKSFIRSLPTEDGVQKDEALILLDNLQVDGGISETNYGEVHELLRSYIIHHIAILR